MLSKILQIILLSLIMCSLMVKGYFRVGKKKTINQNEDLLAIPVKYVRVIRENKRQGPSNAAEFAAKRALPPNMYHHHTINNPFNPAPIDKHWSPYENILFVKKRFNQGEAKREIVVLKERSESAKRDALNDAVEQGKVKPEIILVRKRNAESFVGYEGVNPLGKPSFEDKPRFVLLKKRDSTEQIIENPDRQKLTVITRRGSGSQPGKHEVMIIKESDIPRIGDVKLESKQDPIELVAAEGSEIIGEESRRQVDGVPNDVFDGGNEILKNKPLEMIITE